MALSASQRTQRARIAALSRWAAEDPTAGTQKARDGFNRRFLDLVDPSRELPAAERERRATAARKAHMARLALKSAKVRQARRSA